MGWRGTIRAMEAAERRAQRDAQRRFKELQRRNKEQAKLNALDAARLEVETNENQIELLTSIHKEQGETWNWEQILNLPPPGEPVRIYHHETEVDARLAAYVPGFFDKLFGKAKSKIAAFEIEKQMANARDEREFQEAWSEYQKNYTEWDNEKQLAAAVLAGDREAYVRVIQEYSPFSELADLGSSLSFRVHTARLLEVTVKVNGEKTIPSEIKSLTSSGKVSTKAMPKGRFQEIYQDYVCGCVLRVGREVFALLPAEIVIVTAQSDLFDSRTGKATEQPILSVAIPRSVLANLNFELIDPSAAIANFLNRGDFQTSRKSGIFIPITPLTPEDIAFNEAPEVAKATSAGSNATPAPPKTEPPLPAKSSPETIPPSFIPSVFSCGESTQAPSQTAQFSASQPLARNPRSNPISSKWAEALRRGEIQFGFLRVTVTELADLLGYPAKDNYILSESKMMARTVEGFGYCLEPDPRHGAGNFWGTRELGVFQPPSGAIEAPSESFLGASALLQLCLLVAAADGTVDKTELDQFRKFIDSHFNFTPDEHQRIIVLETLLARNPTTAKITLGRTAKRVPPDKQLVIAQFLVDVAAADGVFSPAEHKALSRIFEALGLSGATLETLIQNLSIKRSEVIIQAAESGRLGERISAPAGERPSGLQLDMARVAAISAETNEVIGLLARAMTEDDGNGEPLPTPKASVPGKTVPTAIEPALPKLLYPGIEMLEPKFQQLLQRLTTQDSWSRSEFEALSREHQLMPLNVFDAINEWADQQLGDFLLEGEEPITVRKSLLKI